MNKHLVMLQRMKEIYYHRQIDLISLLIVYCLNLLSLLYFFLVRQESFFLSFLHKIHLPLLLFVFLRLYFFLVRQESFFLSVFYYIHLPLINYMFLLFCLLLLLRLLLLLLLLFWLLLLLHLPLLLFFKLNCNE